MADLTRSRSRTVVSGTGQPAGLGKWMRLARWVLVWEQVWPGLVPSLSLAGIFLVLALLGVFALLPGWLHLLALIGLAAGFAALLWRGLRRVAWPGADQAARRLERDAGLAHRPLAAIGDRLGSDRSDPMGRLLWDIHRRRMAALAARLRLGAPHPGMAALDPWGLRVVVPLLLVIAAFIAGAKGPARLAAALSPHVGSLGMIGHAKVWITPPAYTKLPPMVLGATSRPVIVPAGSRVTAILSGGWGRADLEIGGHEYPFERQGNGSQRIGHLTVRGDRIAIHQAFQTVRSWPIRVAVDALPSIAFTAPVAGGRNGLLHLAARASDDYGVAAAWVTIRRNGSGPSGRTRTVALPVPADQPRQVTMSVWCDLTSWPWAGLPVTVRPMVKDSDGQVAGGLPVTIILPRRHFTDPAARAIIRQRRRLTRDRADAPEAIRVLDAISNNPHLFKGDLATFLDMRLARRDLAGSNFDLAEVQSLMWQAALRIEDGRAGLAQQNLETTSQALQRAIDSGASTARILRLLNRVRAALDRLAREVARRDRHGTAPPMMESGGRVIDAGTLAHMIDRMRALAESGSKAALRRMVQDLSRLTAHLSVRPQAPGPSAKSMRALRDLARRQQALLDRSFRQNQQGVTPVAPKQENPFFAQRPPIAPTHPSRGNGTKDAKAQAALRRALLRALPGVGVGAGAAKSLAGAARAMGRAAKDLAADDWQDAAPHQARALRALNATIRRLRARTASSVPGDPLGRPLPSFYGDNTIPIPDRATLRQAGKILRELRRRAGDWQRPQSERDYLDRLLRQF